MENIFDQYANEYDQWFVDNDLLYKAELDAVYSLLDNNKRYIEVGVGTGLFASKLNIKEGIEPSIAMSKIAEKRGIKVINTVAEQLPYKNNSLDGIVMITVDCFVKDLLTLFKEANRVIKNQNDYIIAFLNRETPLGHMYNDNKENDVYYKDAIFRSYDEMKDILEKANFKIITCKQTVFELENKNQPVIDGYGKGIFTVIKAKKEI